MLGGLRRHGRQRHREVARGGGGWGTGARRAETRAESLGIRCGVILLLHNRYRLPGGEERAVEDLRWLIARAPAARTRRCSSATRPCSATGAPRSACCAAGCEPEDVAHAVRRTGARVVHAHNVNPSFGWRALAAAREAGARVVLHLHNYRLVCAQGAVLHAAGRTAPAATAATRAPGVRLNCRGSRAEAVAYAAGLALWQRRLAEQVDAFVVPSAFALGRLRELGAPLGRARPRDRLRAARDRRGLDRRRPAASRWPPAGCRRRRGSPTRSTPRAIPGCRSWSPATARRRPSCASGPPGVDVRFTGALAAGRPRRAAPRGGGRGRALPLRRDPPAGRAGGDGGRAARGGRRRRRARGGRSRRRAAIRRATPRALAERVRALWADRRRRRACTRRGPRALRPGAIAGAGCAPCTTAPIARNFGPAVAKD